MGLLACSSSWLVGTPRKSVLSELLARVVPTATAARSAATATDGVQRVGCVASNDALRSPEPRDRCMVSSRSAV